jgi:perosamine synthetase
MSSSIRAQSVFAEIRDWPELTKVQYLRSMIRTAFFDIATQPGVSPIITFPIHKRSVLNSRGEYLPQVRSDNNTLAPSLRTRPSKAAAWELTRKLPQVEGHLLRRRSIASIYHSFFAERLVSGETEALVMQNSSFIHYPIFVESDHRDAVYRRLLSTNYHVGISAYPNVHEIDGFKNIPGRSTNVANLVRSVITLPTHRKITEKYAAELAFAVRDAISVESRVFRGAETCKEQGPTKSH